MYTERAVGGIPTGAWCRLPGAPDVDARAVFFERFASAAAAGSTPEVSAADGLAVQAFVEAAYRSVAEGTPVAVEFPEPAEVA